MSFIKRSSNTLGLNFRPNADQKHLYLTALERESTVDYLSQLSPSLPLNHYSQGFLNGGHGSMIVSNLGPYLLVTFILQNTLKGLQKPYTLCGLSQLKGKAHTSESHCISDINLDYIIANRVCVSLNKECRH